MKENLETDFKVPLKIVNVPQDVILTSELPGYLQVRAKDKGATLFSYSFSRPVPTCEIDYRDLLLKRGMAVITPDYILNKLRKRFVVGMELRSVFPETIILSFSKGESKIVPVRLISSISTEHSFGLSNTIQLFPSQIKVYAPSDKLAEIKAVFTNVLRLSALKDTSVNVVSLKKLEGVKFIPDKIKVVVPVESFTEKTIEIPVVGVNVPMGYNMRLFPATVRGVCLVALSHYNSVQAKDFTVVVDFNDLKNNNSGKQHVKVLKKPGFVSNVRYQPDEVDVLMEEIAK